MHLESNPDVLGSIWGEVEEVEKRRSWLLLQVRRNDHSWPPQAGEVCDTEWNVCAVNAVIQTECCSQLDDG